MAKPAGDLNTLEPRVFSTNSLAWNQRPSSVSKSTRPTHSRLTYRLASSTAAHWR